jgi:hypothetical protein
MMSARFEKLLHHISPARDTASALHRGASSGAVWHLGQTPGGWRGVEVITSSVAFRRDILSALTGVSA